jgi:hypothetical protein
MAIWRGVFDNGRALLGLGDGAARTTSMGLGKGALLWLIGIPLPVIILLAIIMHH